MRLVLGSLSVVAFGRFREAVERVFGRPVAVWLVCITVTQFHLMFYLTRTLPNMMALPLGEFQCCLGTAALEVISGKVWKLPICVVSMTCCYCMTMYTRVRFCAFTDHV